jgi:hypothetical protein
MPSPRNKPAAIGINAAYPGFIEPALATSISKVPSGERWVHEIKFDGYRKARPKGENVVDLMDALKRSIANDRGAEPAKGKKPRKAVTGQKEMLLPISGKRVAKAETKKEKPAASRARKRA